MRASRLVQVTRAVLILGMVVAAVQAASFLLGPLGLGMDFPRLGGWVPEGVYVMSAQGELAVPASVDLDLSWENGPDGATDSVTGLPAVELTGPWTAHVRLLNPSRGEQSAYVAVRALTWILIAVILWVLLRIVSSIRGGTPFTRTNAKRLWTLAGLFAIGGTLVSMANSWLNNELIQNSAASSAFQPSATFSLVPLLVGLLITVLGVTWSRGIALEEDTEGLV